jgi:hypothetical protein
LICAEWAARHAEPKTVEVETPAPIILQVEVPKPANFQELLASLDVGSLTALLVTKMNEPVQQTNKLLQEIAERLGAQKPAAPAKAPSLPVVFQARPVKRNPRVALVGPLDSQFADINREIEKHGIAVDIRQLNKDYAQPTFPSCDYIIVQKHTSHRWWNSAQATLASDRVFFIDGGITQIVQKLRDIASRQ